MRPLIEGNVRQIEKDKQSGTAATPHPNWFKMLEEAPVIVRMPHIDGVIDGVIQHGRMRNLFETGTGMGSRNKNLRKEAENDVLNIDFNTPHEERPIYGMLGVNHYMHKNGIFRDDFEIAPSPHYGSLVLQMKPHVKDRTTFIEGDSLDNGNFHTVFDSKNLHYFPFVASQRELNPQELYADQGSVSYANYIEAQIHGGVNFLNDVDSIHVKMPKEVFHEDENVIKGKLDTIPKELDVLEQVLLAYRTYGHYKKTTRLQEQAKSIEAFLNARRLGEHFGIPVHVHVIDAPEESAYIFGPRVGEHRFLPSDPERKRLSPADELFQTLNRTEALMDKIWSLTKSDSHLFDAIGDDDSNIPEENHYGIVKNFLESNPEKMVKGLENTANSQLRHLTDEQVKEIYSRAKDLLPDHMLGSLEEEVENREPQNRPVVFWNMYEQQIRPEHLAVAKSMATNRLESHTDRSGRMGTSRVYLPHLQSFRDYAKRQQDSVIKDIQSGKIEGKQIGGDWHVKVYRGVTGDYANDILSSVQHNSSSPQSIRLKDATVSIPCLNLSGWTTDRDIAKGYAADFKTPNYGVVMGAYFPVKSIVHSGFSEGQYHEHPHEKELIFTHPEENPTHLIDTKNMELVDGKTRDWVPVSYVKDELGKSETLTKMAKPNVSFPQLSTRSPSAAPIVRPAIVPYRAGLMGQDPSADYSHTVGATIQRGTSKPVKEEGKAGRANPTFHQSGFIASDRTGKEIAATEGHEKWHTALQDLRAKYHPAAVFDLITKLGGRVHNDIYANPVSKHLFDIAVKETPAEHKNASPYEEFFAYVHTFLNDPTFRKQVHENLGMTDAQAQRDAYKHVDNIRKQAQTFADTFDESMIDPQYIPKTTQAPTGVMKSENNLLKVSRTPEEMSAGMTPHKPSHYEAYDTIETFPVGEMGWMNGRKGMLYHHVYKKPATKNGYVSYLHVISVDPNPLNETGIISSSTMGTESVQRFLADPFPAPKDKVNIPWKDGEVASIGETATDVPAQNRGLATLLYLDALKYHGRLMSDTLTSEGADKVWDKILKHPEVNGCHGHGDPFHRHWAEWKGDKSVPSNVIQMGGKSIAQMKLSKSEDILDTLNKFEEMFDLLLKNEAARKFFPTMDEHWQHLDQHYPLPKWEQGHRASFGQWHSQGDPEKYANASTESVASGQSDSHTRMGVHAQTDLAHPDNKSFLVNLTNRIAQTINPHTPVGVKDIQFGDLYKPDWLGSYYEGTGQITIRPDHAWHFTRPLSEDPASFEIEHPHTEGWRTLVHEAAHAASTRDALLGYEPHEQDLRPHAALEEATTELLAQHYTPQVIKSLDIVGKHRMNPNALEHFNTSEDGEVVLIRPTAYFTHCQQFGKLIAVTEGVGRRPDWRSTDDWKPALQEENRLNQAIVHWAHKIKNSTGWVTQRYHDIAEAMTKNRLKREEGKPIVDSKGELSITGMNAAFELYLDITQNLRFLEKNVPQAKLEEALQKVAEKHGLKVI